MLWTVVLEKTLESPLDCKEIQPVHPKGDQSWVFIGGTDAEAETPIPWTPYAKSWHIWKDPDTGKDWRQEERGLTEDEMVGWHGPPTQWTWVLVDPRNWWWTGRPGVLWFMGSQRAGHNWMTKLNWNELSSLARSLLRFLPHWLIGFAFFLLNFKSSSSILNTSLLSDVSFWNIFYQSVAWLSILLVMSATEQFKGSQRVRHDWATELNWIDSDPDNHYGDITHL